MPELADNPELAPLRISGVQQDSRHVRPGDVFVAIRGLTVDGHQFAQQAARSGAALVVAERPLELTVSGRQVPCLVVDDATRTLGQLSGRLAGDPSARMDLAGITGTNGKTTTAFVLEAMLLRAGKHPGLVGTVTYRYGQVQRAAPHTTPPATDLQQLLGEMADAGCTHAVMEVSSHGLQLGRLWGCEFVLAAFTNLTQDHLDLHGSMEAYLQAKTLLFTRHLRRGGTAVINIDGAGSEGILAALPARPDVRLLCCSRHDRAAEAYLGDLRCDLNGIVGNLTIGGATLALQSPMLGEFNADNLLLAATCAHALGVESNAIQAAVADTRCVAGRLERVDDRQDFAVLVDYAHTPDALERALDTLGPLAQGRLIVVFGCGGDRDQKKRPLMGRAAAERADLVVITNDNPRTEDPQAIVDHIVPPVAQRMSLLTDAQVQRPGGPARGYWVQPQRDTAIATAVQWLAPGDILLIAGKGHEDYQIIGNQRLHFDDREQARAALSAKSAGS